jgi:pimeloyl-ACP methyl ester carboxylesterase
VAVPASLADGERLPIVVMAHGFSAVRDQRLAPFAERFADAGYRALVFDYRYFGDSEGEPRQLLDITKQLADWRAAIAYARARTDVDPTKVVVWGTSFSGGHAITLAAEDPNLAAAIAQGPFTDGLGTILSYGLKQIATLTGPAVLDQVGALLGRPTRLIPAVGAPGSGAIIVTDDAVSGFAQVTPPDTLWRNEVAARIGVHVSFYRPITKASRIRCPMLYCLATRDVVTPTALARKTAARTPGAETKEYDAQHFDVYVGEVFDRVVADQVDFLQRAVPLTRSADLRAPAV